MSMTPSFPNAFGPGIWIKLDLMSIHVQNEKRKENRIQHDLDEGREHTTTSVERFTQEIFSEGSTPY